MRIHPRSAAVRRPATLLLAAACVLAAAHANGASSNIVVTMDVVSNTTLVNSCTATGATQLGTIQPGTGATTSTGADVCRLTFGSSNDTSQLRVGQLDGTGTAMRLGMTSPALQFRDNAAGRLQGVFGDGASLAWVAGFGGVLLRTQNGAAAWEEYAVPGVYYDVEMIPGNQNRWWFPGENRVLRYTNDALAITPTFNTVPAASLPGWGAGDDLRSIAIPNATTLFIVGESRRIGKSTDGGTSWSTFQHADATVGTLVGIDFVDANTLMAVADNGKLLTTTLGGDNSGEWTVSTLPGSAGSTMQDIAIMSPTRAAVVGNDGYVATWDGAAWTDRSPDLDIPWDLVGVASKPGEPNGVWAVDETGGIWHSPDQGATWDHRSTPNAGRAGDLHFATASDMYVVGSERSFARSHDGGTTIADANTATWSTHGAVAASPIDGGVAVAVGTRGVVRSTANGGTLWATSTAGNAPLFGVSLANDTTGWAVGAGATIQRTTTAGASWSAQAAPAGVTERLTGVAAIDAYRAVAVGMGGRIITTSNGGAGWTNRTSGSTQALLGVDSWEDDVIVAVGARGTILRSTDLGATWTATPGGSMPDAQAHLVGVAMTSATTGYAATSGSNVWRTVDGGATWTQVAGTTATRNRAIGASGTTIVVAGLNDSTAISTDGGATFTQSTGTTTMHLRGVAVVDEHVAYVVGADGVRMRSEADASPAAQVADWSLGANDWDTSGFFGACLQSIGGGAVADWTIDTFNVAGRCEQLDSDPWRAVPATATIAAHTTVPGTGNVDLVWGARTRPDQLRGAYSAGVAFEVIAP